MAGGESHRGWMLGLGLVVGAVLVGAVVFFLVPGAVSPITFAAEATATATATPLPLGGGVPLDQAESANQRPTAAPQEPGKLAAVTPFITLANVDGLSIVVHSFVPALAESGGTCTAAVVGHPELTASGEASIEVAATTCPPLQITLTEPPADDAQVTVTYSSPTSTGTSSPTAVSQ